MRGGRGAPRQDGRGQAVSLKSPRVADVVALAATGRDPTAIVEGLRRGAPEAAVALYDRVAERVNRLVARMMGADAEHDDVVHQVFLNALESVGALRDPSALDGWIVGVTVNTVRRELRRRRFRRLLRLDLAAHAAGEVEARTRRPNPERDMVARRFYAALERLGADERIAFTLRAVEGCALAEVAMACRCSLATAKRRVARATHLLAEVATKDPVLAAWTEGRSQ